VSCPPRLFCKLYFVTRTKVGARDNTALMVIMALGSRLRGNDEGRKLKYKQKGRLY